MGVSTGGTNMASGGSSGSGTSDEAGVVGTGGSGGSATDSGGAGTSGSGMDSSSPVADGAPKCAGMECTDYATVLAAAPRDATAITNCVIQMHQADCCGAMRAYGVNHGARTTLCPAETACVATYPASASCTSATITTDSGETTNVMNDVKLRCTPKQGGTTCTCQTFVCTNDSCRASPGIEGGCGTQ
jgi:hypothetical protein